MPDTKRRAIRAQKSGTTAESPVKMMEPIREYLMDLFRPIVSARKPHRWEVRAIPAKETQLIRPFLRVSSSSSQVEAGMVILTPMVSSKRAMSPRPEAATT